MTAILLVEDDNVLGESLCELLELEGFTVRLARDGLEGLDRVAAERPSVILLDLMLPRMDGFAFAAELERQGLRPGIPIVIMTADGRAEEKAARLGAEDWLAKPFDVDDLLEKVDRLTRR